MGTLPGVVEVLGGLLLSGRSAPGAAAADHARDVAVMAAVFGVAGFAWFGWAQEAPPRAWRLPLGFGSALSLAVGIAGGALALRDWDMTSALAGEDARRWFGVVAGLEVAFVAVGAAVLARRRAGRWTATWTCIVVGVHFVPLAVIFGDAGLYVLAVALALVATVGIGVARRRGLHPSAVTGLGAGAVLLLFAARSLVVAL
jgi:hypothetical protein